MGRPAGEIEIALTSQQVEQLQPARPVDPRAMDAFFRGLALLESGRSGHGSGDAAIAATEDAIRLAPDFAPAYAQLSIAHAFTAAFLPERRATSLSIARETAQRSLELDPNYGPAHSARAFLAFYFDWDWTTAEREYRRAMELGPARDFARVHLAQVLLATGRTQEALALGQAAVEGVPLNGGVRVQWARVLFFAGAGEAVRSPRDSS